MTNSGPLTATGVVVINQLPAGASVLSMSSGCVASGMAVTCGVASLEAGAAASFTITVRWSVSGPVYDYASVTLDQVNTADSAQRQVAFGSAPSVPEVADAPLPAWSYLLLAAGLLYQALRRRAASALRG